MQAIAKYWNDATKIQRQIAVFIFAGVMAWLLVSARAAGPFSSLELEYGTVSSPASLVNDPLASGDSYVLFGSSSGEVTSRIQAEDYKTGGEGVAYHDTTSGNLYSCTLRNDDVDIKNTSDSGGGCMVGHFAGGEWLKYSINVETAGNYVLTARVTSGLNDGSSFYVELDGNNISGTVPVPYTGSWDNSFDTIGNVLLNLPIGVHDLSIHSDDFFDLNWFELMGPGDVTVEGPPDPPNDSDGDGVPDSSDNCPNEWGPVSNNGCPEDVPPPSDGEYDPSFVGPQASINCPAGAVDVYPSGSLASAASSNPEGTTFCVKAGTHYGQRVTPKNNQTFIGEFGAVMDGQRSVEYAFGPGGAENVTIKNLEIKEYLGKFYQYEGRPAGNGFTHGAITSGTDYVGDAWVVENCNIHNNLSGLMLGDRSVIKNNKVHHNDAVGLKVGWTHDSALVENNEIYNNSNDPYYEPRWEGGGTKFAWTTNITVRNNFSHHNNGPGLWTDIDNVGALYEGNIIEDNAHEGIFHEISGNAIIRNNIIRRNTEDANGLYHAGILVSSSKDTEVYGNIIEDYALCIGGQDYDRGSGGIGWYEVTNLNVHDNTCKRPRDLAVGIYSNRGNQNTYNAVVTGNCYEGVTGNKFQWSSGSYVGWSSWQSYGLDTNGQYNPSGGCD